MQIGFESFPTARQTTNNDSDFVAEISARANERPDMNGAAAFPSQINARVVTQIKNLHLIPPCSKRDSNCAELRSMEKQVSILALAARASRSLSSGEVSSLSSASASLAGLFGGTSRPSPSGVISSGMPETGVQTVGTPLAMPSR